MTALLLGALLLGAIQPQPIFRAGVELVEVDASVTRGNKPVRGLTAANFVVADNGVPQQVTSVALDQLPLSVIMVLDTSASVSGERLDHLIEAGEGLVSALKPRDRVALVTFSQTVTVRVPLTADVKRVADAVSVLQGANATSLRDAVHLALQLRPDDHSRPVVLVFTDGRDTASWLSEEETIESARRSGVVLEVVETGDVPDRRFLDRITEATGGRVWSATSSGDLRALFTRALDEMRGRYLLTFSPQRVSGEGWHALTVTLKDARGDVVARPGYFRPAAR